MALLRAAFCAALVLLGTTLAAQDITLTSRDGEIEISGRFLGYDGEFYRIDSKFGELTLDGSGVLCEGPACPNLSDYVASISFSGASAMASVLMPSLVEGFALRNGYSVARRDVDSHHLVVELSEQGKLAARFRFRSTNTDEGFADLLANEADIVMALREVRPDESRRAFEAGLGDLGAPARNRVLALDAMVPVVAADNPLGMISTPALAQVFAGEISNWVELGGPDAPISAHLVVPGSGLAQAAEDYLLGPAGLTLAPDVTLHDSGSDMVDAVTSDPFSIGLASHAETGTARVLTLTGGCGHRLAASRQTIKTEDYPLTTPMFLYLPARRLPKIGREFMGYLRSNMAQNVIRRVGLVDQAPETIGLQAQGDRFANAILAAGDEVPLAELQRMVGFFMPMQRLTHSFRFETGSTRPDAQSRTNIDLLAQAIEAGEFDGRRLVFVGFSDGDGPASANLRIARARAKAIQGAVLRKAQAADPGRVEVHIEAFGEALPMACDDSEWGRKVNRRVEVWVQ